MIVKVKPIPRRTFRQIDREFDALRNLLTRDRKYRGGLLYGGFDYDEVRAGMTNYGGKNELFLHDEREILRRGIAESGMQNIFLTARWFENPAVAVFNPDFLLKVRSNTYLFSNRRRAVIAVYKVLREGFSENLNS